MAGFRISWVVRPAVEAMSTGDKIPDRVNRTTLLEKIKIPRSTPRLVDVPSTYELVAFVNYRVTHFLHFNPVLKRLGGDVAQLSFIMSNIYALLPYNVTKRHRQLNVSRLIGPEMHLAYS